MVSELVYPWLVMVRILKSILTELTWCFRKTELPQFLFSQNEALTPAAQNGDEPKHLPKLLFDLVPDCCWLHQHLLLLFPFSLLKSSSPFGWWNLQCFWVGWTSKNLRMGISHGFSVVFSPFQKKNVWLCMACFQVTLPASDTMKPWPPQLR